jgi:DNA-binding PucR family transcriptional regulator
VADELARLVVHADPAALGALRERRLAPFAELTARSRERLLPTLASWLRHQGDRQQVADELGIHPQTVRYRVGLLRDVLGEALDDPQSRYELALVLA